MRADKETPRLPIPGDEELTQDERFQLALSRIRESRERLRRGPVS